MSSCKIILHDEVNCKIEGLDTDARRRLVAKFKYEIPYARHLPAVRLGRWDGKVAYFQLGGSTYINLLPEVIDWLTERNYHISLEDRRKNNSFEFTEITEDSFSHISWPEKHERAGQPIMLRDYQVNIINNFLANPQGIQEVATGAGKTIMTAVLSHSVEEYGRSLIIVPNKSLVTQTETDYRNLGLDVGVFYGDRKELGNKHTICTWQSLNIQQKKSKDDLSVYTLFYEHVINDVVAVIVDEVHAAKADALKSLLTDTLAHVPLRWGLTGTVPKNDFEKVALRVSLGEVINQLSASELQAKGVLSNCHVNIVQTQEHAEFTNYQSELQYLMSNSERLDYLSGLVKTIAESGNTLVLVDRISAGTGITERIPGSVFVSGGMDVDDRKEHYDEVAGVNDKIIVATYGVAAVGINIPRIFNLVLIEPGKSFVRVIQSIGRGIRKAEDKDFVQIWDITSSCKFAKRHLTKRKQFYREANYPYTMERTEYK